MATERRTMIFLFARGRRIHGESVVASAEQQKECPARAARIDCGTLLNAPDRRKQRQKRVVRVRPAERNPA